MTLPSPPASTPSATLPCSPHTVTNNNTGVAARAHAAKQNARTTHLQIQQNALRRLTLLFHEIAHVAVQELLRTLEFAMHASLHSDAARSRDAHTCMLCKRCSGAASTTSCFSFLKTRLDNMPRVLHFLIEHMHRDAHAVSDPVQRLSQRQHNPNNSGLQRLVS